MEILSYISFNFNHIVFIVTYLYYQNYSNDLQFNFLDISYQFLNYLIHSILYNFMLARIMIYFKEMST